MYRLAVKQLTRSFSRSPCLRKDDFKKQLSHLGKALQKGTVQKLQLPPEDEVVPQRDPFYALRECSKQYEKELEESFTTIINMSEADIKRHTRMTKGLQWGAFKPRFFLDRAAALRSVPDEIDILKVSSSEYERIYSALDDLDKDLYRRAVKLVGLKNAVYHTPTRSEKISQRVFRDLRRGNFRELPRVLDRELLYRRIYPYNVVGFDRSFHGFELSGTRAISETGQKLLPQEMIEDISGLPNKTKFKIKKEQIHVFDVNVLKNSIEPQCMELPSPQSLLEAIGRLIFVENVENFRRIGPEELPLTDVIRVEIEKLQRSLDLQNVNPKIKKDNRNFGNSSFTYRDRPAERIKTGAYVMTTRVPDTERFRYNYHVQFFDLVPFFGLQLITRQHLHFFYKHLIKVFLINCKRQMGILTHAENKLSPDMKDFTRRLYGRINQIVINKILPVALKHKPFYPQEVDVLLHKPIKGSVFLRIYWNRKPFSKCRNSRHTKQRLQLSVYRVRSSKHTGPTLII